MIFGAVTVLLILLCLAFLIIPVLRTPSVQDSLGREQQNIAIAKEKKALLEDQLREEQMTQAEYESALIDLENSLALDLERQQALGNNLEAGKWAVWVMAVIVPVLSVIMYIQLGEYRVIDDPSLAQAPAQAQMASANAQGKAPSMGDMIERVKNRLKQNPDDVRGWFILGRTLMSVQQYPEAVTALQRAYDLNKQDPNIMFALADGLAMVNDGDMTGEPEKLVHEALKLAPNEVTGIWLAGLAAEQGGRLREAYDYFVRLIPMLSQDANAINELKNILLSLRERQPDLPEVNFETATASVAAPTMGTASTAAAVNGSTVTVSITLDKSLAARAQPDDLLFIYAKAASGPPMPLAAKRMKVSDLPLQVTLSDSDAMMPQMKLSGFDQIIVGARVSKTGNPVGQPGDLFDESEVIQRKTFAGVVEINIDQVK